MEAAGRGGAVLPRLPLRREALAHKGALEPLGVLQLGLVNLQRRGLGPGLYLRDVPHHHRAREEPWLRCDAAEGGAVYLDPWCGSKYIAVTA